MVLWLVASGYLVFQGFYVRAVADSVRSVSIPAVSALTSVMQERRLSVSYLAQQAGNQRRLVDQRQLTDGRLAALRAVASDALGNAPDSIVTRWQRLTEYLDQLPGVRSGIDSRSIDGSGAFRFYNELLDAATDLFDTQARVVPDVTATQGGITATDMFRASDQMSRAASMIDGAFGGRTFGQQDYLAWLDIVGSYHAGLDRAAAHLRPGPAGRLAALKSSDSWRTLVNDEQAIITGGAWQDGVPRSLSPTRARWATQTQQVSDQLLDLTVVQADEVSAEALSAGNNQLLAALLASALAASVAVGAIWWAWRRSKAIPIRLARLGMDASVMVDERLPAVMERLRHNEKVDPRAELSIGKDRDYGNDEIGDLAQLINRSMAVAAGAAVNEARTRQAGLLMLRGIARRPQRPLQSSLQSLEKAQNGADEKQLKLLFDAMHQITQGRRFFENLIILTGDQVGRRFSKPVPVNRVLLAAKAESQHYQRITLRGAPDIPIAGPAVTETIHLLAELLDNALAFSPPTTTVWVTCNEVRHGVAVEIEDGGVGMSAEALERANILLATAPTPDVTDLRDGKQIGLNVVAELAKRSGIRVTLRSSAYGGTLAIVLIPERIIAREDVAAAADAATERPATHGATTLPDTARRHEPRGAAPSRTATAVASPPRPEQPGGDHTVRRSAAVNGSGDPAPPSHRSATPHQERPSTPAGSDGSPGRPPLPTREPQTHIAPGLRDTPTTGVPSGGTSRAGRSPEEARDRLSSYQRGWAAGKTPPAGPPPVGNDDESVDNGGRDA
ncbi:nitrate- and nitrite sensing domain-containing protein [Plantactinospora sp. WMMB334]|uniref:sensor histidine kinase n=1 Tax=Plantactinospora sp. WMMB334 TaxID=3404119 RepID=UPI003B92CAAB